MPPLKKFGEPEDKKPAISYWAKEKIICPVCHKPFEKEVMHKGSGRMIAGSLTDELHRNFEPSKKYGRVYPLIYDIGCCPKCHCSFFWKDFTDIKDISSLDRVMTDESHRREAVEAIFPYYNLREQRTLYDGAAMYYLALLCYEKVDIAYAPTFKRAMICLRLAWLCKDIERVCPGHNYNYIADVFYRKALFFYQQTLINETGRIESIETVGNFGPDMDKNYGYDGVIYLCGLLEYKYGQHEDEELRLKKLDEYKRSIARIFGLGKSSKSKPGPLLDVARSLYDKLTAELSANNIFSEDD
ncbi:DUF2225 domain-containing protein [Treponema sp.]|uniref:DUF2225 domain-containing protein n=1 Tax=Treponema sp. TaxID=166 RepID=UPI0025EBF425|nr:DUF2225 domain-containing protein [Treponema sp.]MCR5218115.1 DUF2225 domain-containing protein [Treponema sp.]